MKMEELERSVVKEEEQEEEMGEDMERSSNSFQQSFLGMDEPPMAFDDSWGLNAGGGDTDGERSQAVCFSLRLESSGGGASPPRQGRRDGEIAGTSSTFTPSPLPKAYSTPSPPPPNTTTPQANPEINASLLDAEIWDDWGQEEYEALPLSQRVNPVALAQRVAQLKTPGNTLSAVIPPCREVIMFNLASSGSKPASLLPTVEILNIHFILIQKCNKHVKHIHCFVTSSYFSTL